MHIRTDRWIACTRSLSFTMKITIVAFFMVAVVAAQPVFPPECSDFEDEQDCIHDCQCMWLTNVSSSTACMPIAPVLCRHGHNVAPLPAHAVKHCDTTCQASLGVALFGSLYLLVLVAFLLSGTITCYCCCRCHAARQRRAAYTPI